MKNGLNEHEMPASSIDLRMPDDLYSASNARLIEIARSGRNWRQAEWIHLCMVLASRLEERRGVIGEKPAEA
jgi:hypothetical protein